MNVETINQAYLFLIFILNGILIGTVFDVFRILRKSFNTPNFVTYIEDILFWIIAALIIMYSLFVFNNGKFRAYIFIGIFLGIAIYMLFFSKFIVNISVKIISFVKKIISVIYKIVSYPISILYKIIIKPLFLIFTKAFNNIAKFVKKNYKLKSKGKKNEILQNKEGF